MSKNYEFFGFIVPAYMLEVLKRYINTGAKPGDFLTAVVENNLSLAVGRADTYNRANLPAYVGYLYNEAPRGCWGSPEKVKAWSKAGGLEGMEKNDE